MHCPSASLPGALFARKDPLRMGLRPSTRRVLGAAPDPHVLPRRPPRGGEHGGRAQGLLAGASVSVRKRPRLQSQGGGNVQCSTEGACPGHGVGQAMSSLRLRSPDMGTQLPPPWDG